MMTTEIPKHTLTTRLFFEQYITNYRGNIHVITEQSKPTGNCLK